jgi:uncharacterized NAD-dependent epimerase/dehydratase family protein
VKLYEDLASACGVFPQARAASVALNTGHLSAEEAAAACRTLQDEIGMPVEDPVRSGAERLLASVGF